MLDDLLSLYKEAYQDRQQIEVLKDKLKENFERAVNRGYLTQVPHDLESGLIYYQERLKHELQQLINQGQFQKAEEVIKYICDPLKKTVQKSTGRRSKVKEESVILEKNLYENKLPKEIYEKSENFSDLLEKARNYRNEHENTKMSWNKLAEYAGMSISYMILIRKQNKIPSDYLVRRIAHALNGEAEVFCKIATRE